MTERKLTLSGGGPASYAVDLDGHDLSKGVRRLTIEVEAGNRPRVEMELTVHAIEVTEIGVKDSHFEVSMPDEAREALITLGWTPPGARPRGISGSLSFSDATPIMICQCAVRCVGDSVNDALIAWSGHVTTAHQDEPWGE